jgi:hypothetical protein
MPPFSSAYVGVEVMVSEDAVAQKVCDKEVFGSQKQALRVWREMRASVLWKAGAADEPKERQLLYMSEAIHGGSVSISPDLTPVGSTVPQTPQTRHRSHE